MAKHYKDSKDPGADTSGRQSSHSSRPQQPPKDFRLGGQVTQGEPFPPGDFSDIGPDAPNAPPPGPGVEADPAIFAEPDPLPLDRPDNDPIDEGASLGEAAGPLDADYNEADYKPPGREHGS